MMTKKPGILFSLLILLTISITAQSQLKGEWQLVSMIDENGLEVSLPEKPKLILTLKKSTFAIRYCNWIDGQYSAGKKNIKITLTRSTAKACPELKTELIFSKLFRSLNTFSVKNGELSLSDKETKSIFKFNKPVLAASLYGKWKLVMMVLERDMAIPLPEQEITLNIEKDKISGNGGCNSYGGSFSQTEKKVKFSKILSTKKWCQDSAPTESQYLDALGKSVNFQIRDGKLNLTDAKNENTLIFERN